MDIKLDIQPEIIQQEVVKAILASSLGDSNKKVIDTEIKELSNTFNKGLKAEVQRAITNHICEVLRSEEYSSKIREAVTNRLSNQITEDFLDSVVKTAFQKVERDYY